MPSDPRLFTRAEDELIVRQSRGEFSIGELRRKLRATIITMNRRAGELGVSLNYKYTGRKRGPILSTHDNLTPARIINDKLLKRLYEVHGDRSYLNDQQR